MASSFAKIVLLILVPFVQIPAICQYFPKQTEDAKIRRDKHIY